MKIIYIKKEKIWIHKFICPKGRERELKLWTIWIIYGKETTEQEQKYRKIIYIFFFKKKKGPQIRRQRLKNEILTVWICI